uniref:Uncharacterized protein n=1 Tax=Anguilla anguilla TaxID=7936 RepID=A0A0E9SF36_ANGAN
MYILLETFLFFFKEIYFKMSCKTLRTFKQKKQMLFSPKCRTIMAGLNTHCNLNSLYL